MKELLVVGRDLSESSKGNAMEWAASYNARPV